MPRSPKGERRLADVIGNAVHVMRIATGEIEDTVPDDAPGCAKPLLSGCEPLGDGVETAGEQ